MNLDSEKVDKVDTIEQCLIDWKDSLLPNIPVAGLLSRNLAVYKWKAPFRAWQLREAVCWRLQDLMAQSYALHQQGHGLGARILLRSGFETLAVLIYLNQLMEQVVNGALKFHDFGAKTIQLLLGSRDQSTKHGSINILTILQKSNKKYSGIEKLYNILSESVHPNYEGLIYGYSKVDREKDETHFANRWMELFGEGHLGAMRLCISTFDHEYNDVWPACMDKLEAWIEANDAELEATKHDPA